MAVKPDQLPSLLKKSLAPVYLVAGSEPLLVQECRDGIIQAARQQGFDEREVLQVGPGFDWGLLRESSATPSLFSSRRIIDVRLPSGKPGREGALELGKMAETPDPDVLLLLSCDQWDTTSRKSQWASKIGRAGVLVEIWPVKPHELPAWIRQRMKRAGLEAVQEAVALLAELVEGNLLAAQQEIDKLLLLDSGPTVTVEAVRRAVGNSARFDAFRLVECMLLGRLDECLRVASGLNRTNVPIQVVTGALYRELALSETASRAIHSGANESSVFRSLRVWPARQGPMKQALRRLTAQDFNRSFSTLSMIDRQGKGRSAGDPWQSLDRLLWFICDPASGRHS